MGNNTLMVAPNGARKQKSDHPALPITTQEIAQTARSCFDAGASGIHLHVRDKHGAHSLDPERYKEAIQAIKELAPKMSIQIATGNAGVFDTNTQFECLRLVLPDAASISVREVTTDMATAQRIYSFCHEAEITVQHIVYDLEDLKILKELFHLGWVRPNQNDVLFVLGQCNPRRIAQPDDVHEFLDASVDLKINWAVSAVGQNELLCAQRAISLGGNIRIGFEGNIQLPNGDIAVDNTQLVALASAMIKETMPHTHRHN